MKTLMGLAGLTMAGFMLLSCNTEVKEANYQIIPLPQEISVMDQAAPFILSNGTKIMYPEGNEKMQKNAEFLASYIKDLTGKSLAVQAGTDGKGIILQLGGNAENPEKENKNIGNSKVFQNKENQGDTVEYTHVKDEAVKFHCTQNTDSFHTPRIQIISRGSVQILSFRLNKTECPWHWEGDWIIPDTEDENVKEIELLVISQGGKLIKMNPQIFSS